MRTVHLWPLPGAFIPGEPAVERDETPERAAELLGWSPPAFTTDPPPDARPAAIQTRPKGGSADSRPTGKE